MTTDLATLDIRSRRQWRAWLAKHHLSSPGVWLVFYKKHTGVTSIRYEDVVSAGIRTISFVTLGLCEEIAVRQRVNAARFPPASLARDANPCPRSQFC